MPHKKKITPPPPAGPRVAILGVRGIPNSYGGFETLTEAIAERLAGFGASVTVYCRAQYFKERPAVYKGARLVYLSTIRCQSLDTPWHTLKSVLHVILRNTAQVVIIVNVGNAPFAFLAKLFGKKVILCVDGLDWQRKKWNMFARWYLQACSFVAGAAAHIMVTDAESVQEYYKAARHRGTVHIPYGTDIDIGTGAPDALSQYGLTAKKYFIYVARFEPENNPLLVVAAYVRSGSEYPLVMIGDNRYNQKYVAEVKRAAGDKKVLFLGYLFGSAYKQILKGALAYIRAAEVGGISPAVVEAMGQGVCVVANDRPENREPLQDTGIFYHLHVAHLAERMAELSRQPERAIQQGLRSAERAMIVYSWDRIAYEFFKLVKRVAPQAVVKIIPLWSPRVVERKKILITGAGGMLGSAMYEYFSREYPVLATSLNQTESWMQPLDVRDRSAFEKVVSEWRPAYILHLPAMTDLEWCEKHLPEAYAVNTLPVRHAAELSTRYGAKLVYVSSSNVFDGEKKYYTDTDEPNPRNVYGLTKQMGALLAEYYARDCLILRLGWLMGGGALKDTKFVAKIVQQIVSGKKELHALTDKSGSISYTRDVAKNLELLLLAGGRGTYNMACLGYATRYDVARQIVEILGYKDQVRVTPVTSGFFSATFTTPRSASECLVNERLIKERLSRMRPWQEALEEYLEQDFGYAFNTQTARAGDFSRPATQSF
ncbi:MAG: sugar nucleotide-binding protein [Candidatus Magasanikbacteria bacterium]|nr:sugar nucleotide-binding protein [Candidatus Magasanikbacteria bacterium]